MRFRLGDLVVSLFGFFLGFHDLSVSFCIGLGFSLDIAFASCATRAAAITGVAGAAGAVASANTEAANRPAMREAISLFVAIPFRFKIHPRNS